MPAWQIDPKEYLRRLNLKQEEFKQRLKLPNIDGVTRIVPLRDLRVIQSLIPVDFEMVLYLLRKIKTFDGQTPFSKIRIQMVRIDPRHLKIGTKICFEI